MQTTLFPLSAPALPFADYAWPADPPAGGRLAIVGEAPGAEEARLGRPFVGRSGKLLDETLSEAGIDRARCLVANVFRFQPPGNKVGHFFSSRAKAKREGWPLDEQWGPFGASDRLLAQWSGELAALADGLARFAPSAIIALGRVPTWALTGALNGDTGILSLRGRVFTSRLGPAVPVVPTFHPSYILRGNFAQRPVFRADMEKAKALAGTPA